ncbi:MAG: methyltransferase [Candidatus Acidiferrales bacterium]
MKGAGGQWIITTLVVCGAGYMFWYVRNDPWPVMRVAGACLIAPAVLLWAVARNQLGTSFSVRAEARALVTHGLYARIRNPIYVFGSVFIVGICLFFERPIFLLLFVAIIPMQIVRARREAAALEAKFGDAYREYRRKVWF